jgi:hypothetical protein
MSVLADARTHTKTSGNADTQNYTNRPRLSGRDLRGEPFLTVSRWRRS